MIYEVRGIRLLPDDSTRMLMPLAAKKAGVREEQIKKMWIRRRSIDARRGRVSIIHSLGIEITGRAKGEVFPIPAEEDWPGPCGEEPLCGPVVVVGAGPAGLMAAHTLREYGYPTLLLERGKRIDERDRDTEGFLSGGALLPDSNILFGEGGAGAYSDGKLTCRNKDAAGRRALELLMAYGAGEEIGYEAKPHLGTDVLKGVITRLTDGIAHRGGRMLFSAKVTGFRERDGKIETLFYEVDGIRHEIRPGAVILAIGHSARDTYRMLDASGVAMEQKPFAVGARIEHHQSMVDQVQFGSYAGHPNLGAAEYALTAKAGERGVYTFCMCPGGYVLPSVSEEGYLCVNGMSYHDRGGENANSALVVQVSAKDFMPGPLGGMEFQEVMEKRAFDYSGSYAAPTQRVEDFLHHRKTRALGDVHPTYPLGQEFCELDEVLPPQVTGAMREALPALGRKLRGFDAPDAVLTGVESRTSAPVRIVRDAAGVSPSLNNLYPAGEGSGYAGGIISAGADGIKAARKVMERFLCTSYDFTL